MQLKFLHIMKTTIIRNNFWKFAGPVAGSSGSPDVFSPSVTKQTSQRGFDFSGPENPTVFPVFGTPPTASTNPFVFGSSLPG